MTPTKPDLQRLIAEFERVVRGLVAGLVAGQITLAVFDAEMRGEIRRHHLAAGILANAGEPPTDTSAIQSMIDDQLRYFDRWMTGMYLGSLPPEGLAALLEQYVAEQQSRQPDNTGALLAVGGALLSTVTQAFTVAQRNAPTALNAAALAARAASYGKAVNQTAQRVQAKALGLPVLPFYRADRTICRNACYCDWVFVTLAGDGNWDCYWTLDYHGKPLEHCPTCLAREHAANPLRIRSGVIVDPDRYQRPELYA